MYVPSHIEGSSDDGILSVCIEAKEKERCGVKGVRIIGSYSLEEVIGLSL